LLVSGHAGRLGIISDAYPATIQLLPFFAAATGVKFIIAATDRQIIVIMTLLPRYPGG
jgi:hypothetical protein